MKFLKANTIAILSLIVSILIALIAWGYRADQNHLQESINIESINRKNADTQIRFDHAEDLANHNINVHQALTNEIKAVTESNIRTEEKIDKILFLLAKDR